MSACVEHGTCEYCGIKGPINRKYFKYGIHCECHSPEHFELVFHCDKCEPIDPGIQKIKLTKEQKHKTFKL